MTGSTYMGFYIALHQLTFVFFVNKIRNHESVLFFWFVRKQSFFFVSLLLLISVLIIRFCMALPQLMVTNVTFNKILNHESVLLDFFGSQENIFQSSFYIFTWSFRLNLWFWKELNLLPEVHGILYSYLCVIFLSIKFKNRKVFYFFDS